MLLVTGGAYPCVDEPRHLQRARLIREEARRRVETPELRERADAHSPGLARGAVAARRGQRRKSTQSSP